MASAGAGSANEQPHQPRLSQRQGHLYDAFPFENLPFAIRRRVYLFLGLPTLECISLNEIPKVVPTDIVKSFREKDHLATPPRGCDLYDKNDNASQQGFRHGPIYNILLVSKTMSNEVRSIFFSENAIAVGQHQWGGLRALEDVGPHAWRNLRELVVRLEPCRCPTQFCTRPAGWVANPRGPNLGNELCSFFAGYQYRDAKHCRRLSKGNPNDERTLLQWGRICAGIAAHGRPGRLRVLFFGAVGDVEMARRITGPLFELPRPLDVKISFCNPPDRFDPPEEFVALRDIAMDVTLRILDGPPSDKPFRFMDLPVELQIKVLEYTLGNVRSVKVAPGGHECFSPLPRCSERWFQCRPDREDLGFWERRGYPAWGFRDDDTVLPERCKAFCRAHAAAFHKGCIDYPPTLSWCLVSRRFGDLVRSVFYSRIRFTLLADYRASSDSVRTDADTGRSCGPGAFLTVLRRHWSARSLRHFRLLDLVFPVISAEYLTPERASWGLWLEVVNVLATGADVPKLVLTVCFPREPLEMGRKDWEEQKKVGGWEKLEEAYMQIIRCLEPLAGLRGLFVYVPWPVGPGWVAEERGAAERKIEQAVMGASYDSRLLGKAVDHPYSKGF